MNVGILIVFAIGGAIGVVIGGTFAFIASGLVWVKGLAQQGFVIHKGRIYRIGDVGDDNDRTN